MTGLPLQEPIGSSVRAPQRVVPAGDGARGHPSAHLRLDPLLAADASAYRHDLVTQFRQRADHCADVDGAAGLPRQINARIKAQIENLHGFLRAETVGVVTLHSVRSKLP